jgi:hypothetical protein
MTTVATGSYVSTPAVAGSATQVSTPKIVIGSGVFAASATDTVTLYGSAVFSNANYRCTVQNTGSINNRLQVSGKSTSGFTVTSQSSTSDTFDYTCIGN